MGKHDIGRSRRSREVQAVQAVSTMAHDKFRRYHQISHDSHKMMQDMARNTVLPHILPLFKKEEKKKTPSHIQKE
jgi:hypothetical protein